MPARLAGKYRVRKFLGSGAMGAVYEVERPDGSPAAAKVLLRLPEATDPDDQVARFLREASATAFISHPNVVAVHDVGIDVDLGAPYYVMDLLSGFDLDALLERVGALHPAAATHIALQACEGLRAAHDKGVIHRDVKPSNLFLHHEGDGSITVKVCDFGIAKWTLPGGDLTRSGAMLGTPLYMAPEQALDPRHVDARADLWSLGMTLYHALAGRPAHDRVGSFFELMVALRDKDTVSVQDFAPWVEPNLAVVVHGLLIRNREARCPAASALASALRPLVRPGDALKLDALAPVSDAVRAVSAPRAVLRGTWDEGVADERGVESTLVLPSASPIRTRLLESRYRITRMIGRGGMAAVYEALTPEGTSVAIKFILDEAGGKGTEARRRFVREAKALKEISSPYVVGVLDASTDPDDGAPFIVLELMKGGDLAHLVRTWGALEPAPVARLLVQICEGLAAAHELGIIHRDIKPANLFLDEQDDGTVIPKICDFGIAKRPAGQPDQSMDLTRTGGLVGSPLYMSPEQARNAKDVDSRTDVWGVGISLWEAICGHKPWESCSSVGELVLEICGRPITPLQDLAPWVEPGLAAVVHKCLQIDPAERYATVLEVAQALEPFAAPVQRVPCSMLLPVSQALRERVAPRIEPSAAPGSSVSMSGTAADRVRTRSAGGRTATVAIAAGVLLLAGVGVALGVKLKVGVSSSAADSVAGAALPSVPLPAPAPRVSATVAIEPGTARVLVDGVESGVVDGGVVVQGRPGQRFEIVVEEGLARNQESVVLDGEGRVTPVLVRAAAPMEAGVAPGASRPGGRPGAMESASAKGKPGETAAPPMTTTPATPAATPTGALPPDDTWR